MKIIEVQIKKFKQLKNLNFTLDGKDILITGENGYGKSGVLQFIMTALGDTSKIPPDAEGSGMVVTNKDGEEYIFKLRFKDGKPIVEVTSPDGMKDTRKSVIKQVVGAIDFDVEEFVKLSDTEKGRKEQVEIYKSLMDKETIDALAKMENKWKKAYEDRTSFNREAKILEGFIQASPLWGEDLNIQPVDVSDLQSKVKEADKHNNAILSVKQGLQERKNIKTRNNIRLDELRSEIARIEAENENIDVDIKKGEDWLKTHKEVNTDEWNRQIAEASDINAKAQQAVEVKKNMEKLEYYKEQAGEMTVLIETTKQAIEETIRTLNPVVEGLLFDEEQLLYHGTPVSTASLSYSEIAYLGLELKMAQNPEFGVLCIDNAESIGTKRLKEIQDLSKKKDWQILMAEVKRGQEELKIEIMGE